MSWKFLAAGAAGAVAAAVLAGCAPSHRSQPDEPEPSKTRSEAAAGSAAEASTEAAAKATARSAGRAPADAAAATPWRPGGSPDAPPPVPREFRGVWVASVSNIDWPSRRGLGVDEQKAELLEILDRSRDLGLNAVILQVRPAADALYASELEPWSEYLTGEQGRAPEPGWDPLAFAVEEAHRRGLELHAWFNPFRARHPSARGPEAATHISRTRPDLVRVYGRHLWMDPGEPEVRDYSIRVILDVVRRYDVDGAHIDDYFYPYKERDEAGRILDFPDSASYARYVASGGRLSRDDWRRWNVDDFVERLYEEVKRSKPWVKVGVSPIGTWRPGVAPQLRGFDAYEQIYADARKWLWNGWLDYFVPQLYWPIARPDVSFPVLLQWWSEQNPTGRHIYPGLIPNRVVGAGEDAWPPSEIVGQVYVARGHPGAQGHVHFSMRTFLAPRDTPTVVLAALADTGAVGKGSPGAPAAGAATGEAKASPPAAGPATQSEASAAAADSILERWRRVEARRDTLSLRLRDEVYAFPALPPAMPWLDDAAPARPRAELVAGAGPDRVAEVRFSPGDTEAPFAWVVRARFGDRWTTTILSGRARSYDLVSPDPEAGPLGAVFVTAVDRAGNESEPAEVRP